MVLLTNKMILHAWYENSETIFFLKQPATFGDIVPENWQTIFYLFLQLAWAYSCHSNLFYLLDVLPPWKEKWIFKKYKLYKSGKVSWALASQLPRGDLNCSCMSVSSPKGATAYWAPAMALCQETNIKKKTRNKPSWILNIISFLHRKTLVKHLLWARNCSGY